MPASEVRHVSIIPEHCGVATVTVTSGKQHPVSTGPSSHGIPGFQHEGAPGQADPVRNTPSATRGRGRLGRQQRGDDLGAIVAHKTRAHVPGLPHATRL